MAKRGIKRGYLYQKGGWWYLRSQVDGRKISEALKTKDKAEAEAIRRERMAGVIDWDSRIKAMEMQLARLKGEHKQKPVKVSELLGKYWNHPDRYPGSRRILQRVFDLLQKWLRDDPEAGKIDAELGCRFINAMASYGLKKPSLIMYVGALARVWRTVLPDLPVPWRVQYVKRNFRYDVIKHRRLTVKECRDLFNHAEKDGKEMQGIFLLAYSTGLRLKDCCMLTWGAIDFDSEFLNVTPFKTRLTRSIALKIPMTNELKLWLWETKEKAFRKEYDDFVFPDMAAEYQKPSNGRVNYRIKKVFRNADVYATESGTASFHSFRVTWQSRADDAMVSRVITRNVLGHNSSSMSDAYSQLDLQITKNEVRRAVEPLIG